MIFLKKTLAVCMIGFGVRRIIGTSSSSNGMGVWDRSNTSHFRINLALQVR